MASGKHKLQMHEVPVALLAGGRATRLGQIAADVPKALVEVAGRPFVEHQLELLNRNGVRNVVMCIGHLGEQIEKHIGDGSAFGLCVRYSHDGDSPAGTGGAIRWATPFLGEVFWVMYGDSYMDIDYAAALDRFQQVRRLGLMTVIRNENRWDRSNVEFSNGRLRRYDKRNPSAEMAYIDYGVQLLRKQAITGIEVGATADLSDIYSDLVERGQMVSHEVTQRFHEIGTPQSLEETRQYLQRTKGFRSLDAA